MMKIGVLIQGGFSEFTVETINNYTNNNVIICLSTWEDDYSLNKEIIDDLNKIENFVLVLSNKPKLPGLANINYQLVSTLNGLNKLYELECDISIKTRTDFRFNLDELTSFIPKLEDNVLCFYPGNLENNPFVVPDYLFISKTINLINMFDIPLSNYGNEREIKNFINKKHENIIETINTFSWGYNKSCCMEYELSVEAYIVINYFKKLGYIIPKSKLLVHFYSIHLLMKHFNFIDSKKVYFDNIKNHQIDACINSLTDYKRIVESEQNIKLLSIIIKKLLKDFLYRSKSYIYFIIKLLLKKY